MKKKAILAASLAFALMAASLGGMDVSAEEGADTLAREESQAEAPLSENEVLGSLRDVRFSDNLGWCSFSFPLTQSDIYYAHIWVYRDGEQIMEYDGITEKGTHWWYPYMGEPNGSYTTMRTPFYLDLEESGSYYFKVRMEMQNGDSLALSDTVTSDTVQYTRPEQALGTTTGYWDTEKEGLFHFTSVEGAAGYEYRLYRQDGGQWSPCSLAGIRIDTGYLHAKLGHLSIFNEITSGSPRDAGGEDRTIDFSSNLRGKPEGSYCVTVRALSNNLNEIANGIEGEKSDILQIGSGFGQEDASDSDQGGAPVSGREEKPSLLETKIEAAQPGEIVRMQDVTTISSSEVRLLLDRGLTLEMEYTYEGVDYKVRIPADASMDENIPWYGPLYLAQHYGVNSLGSSSAAGGSSYTVQPGDTLGKIARANHMTLAELSAKNPQIKNVDMVIPGQSIQIK